MKSSPKLQYFGVEDIISNKESCPEISFAESQRIQKNPLESQKITDNNDGAAPVVAIAMMVILVTTLMMMVMDE